MRDSINLPRDTTLLRLATAMEESNAIANAEIDAQYAGNITPENIDKMFLSWWAAANTGAYTKTQLLERWFNLLQDTSVYGVKLPLHAGSASSDGTLTDDSAALGVCTPSTASKAGNDPYCKRPAFWCIEVNYEIDNDGEVEIKGVAKVDPEFTRDGSNGMVGVAQKSGWISYTSDGQYFIKRYSVTRLNGYIPLPECVKPDGKTVRAFTVHAKYMAGMDSNGLPTSASGLAPLNYSHSHNSQITLWRKRGANYAGISVCDLAFRIHMFQLKYAKKGNSGVLEGCSSYNYQYKAAAAESGVTRVLLTAAQAQNLLVGSNVILGTAGSDGSIDRNTGSMHSIATNVRIKSITDVTVSDVAYKAINIDTDKTFDVTIDTYISTMPWWSGSCDDVLGVDGSPASCTSGKEPFIIQGLESQVGGYAVASDVIHVQTISDDQMTLAPKVVRLAKNISTGATANYVDFDKPTTIPKPSAWQWHYIWDQQFSKKMPELYLPSEIDGGAGSTNGCKSAVNLSPAAGSFEWLAWGNLNDGGTCGLGALALSRGLGGAGWHILAGACGSGASRGEWHG